MLYKYIYIPIIVGPPGKTSKQVSSLGPYISPTTKLLACTPQKKAVLAELQWWTISMKNMEAFNGALIYKYWETHPMCNLYIYTYTYRYTYTYLYLYLTNYLSIYNSK
jgi:hypothetical protein